MIFDVLILRSLMDLWSGDSSPFQIQSQVSFTDILYRFFEIVITILKVLFDFLVFLVGQDFGWLITTCFGFWLLHFFAVSLIFNTYQNSKKSASKLFKKGIRYCQQFLIWSMKTILLRAFKAIKYLLKTGRMERLKQQLRLARERFLSFFHKGG